MPEENPFHALLVRHCGFVAREMVAIDARIAGADLSTEGTSAVMCDVRDLVHKMHGSSGTLGFGELSGIAGRLEHVLDAALRGIWPPEAGVTRDIEALLDELRQRVQIRPEDSSLFGFNPSMLQSAG